MANGNWMDVSDSNGHRFALPKENPFVRRWLRLKFDNHIALSARVSPAKILFRSNEAEGDFGRGSPASCICHFTVTQSQASCDAPA